MAIFGCAKEGNQFLEIGTMELCKCYFCCSVSYPNALKSTLYADSTQKVVASFSIKDKLSNLDFEPHQVFMRMVHIESDQEVFFVCEKSAGQYEFEMKLKVRRRRI